MSGGRLDFVYMKVEDALGDMPSNTPERRAFRHHLKMVARALKALEWNLSGDGNDEDERAAIKAVLGGHDILKAAVEQAHEAMEALRRALEGVPK